MLHIKKAMRKVSPICRYGLVVAAIVLVADQLSKWWLIRVMDVSDGRIELTPFFNLVMVWNYGVSFGMFSNPGAEMTKFMLIGLALAIVAVVLFWLYSAMHRYSAFAYGIIIGGAIGNIIDRLVYGAVADFFDVHIAGYHWPAFNIADSAICIGVLMVLAEGFVVKNTHSEMKE